MTLAQNIMHTIGAGMGYGANEDALAVDIFQKFNSCKESNWVEKIVASSKYEGPAQESVKCFEDDMVASLREGNLQIVDVEGTAHNLKWEDFEETFATIANSNYSWVLEHLMSSWDARAERAADTFIQICVFGSLVYFG